MLINGWSGVQFTTRAQSFVPRSNLTYFFNINLATVRPRVSLHPGPSYVVEGSDAILPSCHVTGHPQPVVTWSKSFGQLPHGRVQLNSSVIKLLAVRKSDSDNYLCTARNLLGSIVKRTVLVVVSLPHFTVKPPEKFDTVLRDTLTLNCSATGDPKPVIIWKRGGATLPVGRSQQINGALVVRDVGIHDAGKYVCVATSAELFHKETTTYVEVAQATGEFKKVYIGNGFMIRVNVKSGYMSVSHPWLFLSF